MIKEAYRPKLMALTCYNLEENDTGKSTVGKAVYLILSYKLLI